MISPLTQAWCPFTDTYYIYGGGGAGAISITPVAGDSRMTAGDIYTPGSFGSLFYSPSFTISQQICDQDNAEHIRTFDVKIGTDADKRFCTLRMSDGAWDYGKVVNVQCVGDITYKSLDQDGHEYYIYFK